MSGGFQHHIPQFFLRGFRAPGGSKKQSKTWFFEKGNAPRLTTIKSEVGAEDFFYSQASVDSSETLDERITGYENLFALRVQELRNTPVGSAIDPARAAEVVAHLTIRNAHLRHAFADAVKSLLNRLMALFCQESTLRPLLGVDDKTPSPAIRKLIDEQLADNPTWANSGIPTTVLYRMAHTMLRERFKTLFVEQLPRLLLVFGAMIAGTPQAARDGHNQALSSGFAPDGRTELLKKLNWITCAAPDKCFVLPDCVALGIDRHGVFKSLIITDLIEATAVLMPLSGTRMLVGTAPGCSAPNLAQFNEAAASWSYKFFVAPEKCPEFENLTKTISASIDSWVEQTINPVVEEIYRERGVTIGPTEGPTPTASGDMAQTAEPVPTSNPPLYSVHFLGCADQETAEKIAATLNVITKELSRMMSLDRLDGVTLAHDYADALRELDRGFVATTPLQPTDEEYGVGIAMAPLVVRNGIPKRHLVMRGDIGHYLISENEDDWRFAIHIVVQQLAHVANLQLLDETLPGVILNGLQDSYAAFLYPYVDEAWDAYFSSRASASFNPTAGEGYGDLLVSVLERAAKDIPEARLAYRLHGDVDQLLQVALPRIADVLKFSGKVLGHCDGLPEPILERIKTAEALERSNLQDWFVVFDRELSRLWDQRGTWKSFEEFLLLSQHVERLLWHFGLVPWKMDDGRIRVEVPLGTDADRLASL